MCFPDGSGKEPACNVGDMGSVSGSGRSSEQWKHNPLQYSCSGKFHGQKSSVVEAQSMRSQESDMT